MQKKLSKLLGLNKDNFDFLVSSKEIKLRKASLIPTTKVGDEMALTSVLLSSFKLIKEFRKLIQSDMKMSKAGELFVYTEIEFPGFPKSRVDGLMLVVQSGVIKDACLLEMKNGSSLLDKGQIENYLEIAKKYSIPKLATVSNEYVSEPTQNPLDIKAPKGVDLFHFSWSYLLTLSHLLLLKNDMNIEDADQIEIMKEVVNYFESEKSGVCGFTQMKAGWTKTIAKINSGTLVSSNDQDVRDAVLSWMQEEQDIALMLSRELGVLVKSGESKFKSQYQKRFEHDLRELTTTKRLYSTFQISGAISDVKVIGLFEKRAVEISVTVKVPKDKTIRGQIGWIRRQLERCSKKSEAGFTSISDEIYLEVFIKNSTKSLRVSHLDIDKVAEELKGKKLRECKIIQLKDFGKMYASRVKFVTNIESMALGFYSLIIQHLKKWDAPAPQISTVTQHVGTEGTSILKPVHEIQEESPCVLQSKDEGETEEDYEDKVLDETAQIPVDEEIAS